MKPDFDKAQNAATNLLLQQEIRSLYIDVRNFKLPDHIYIDSIQKYCSMTGIPSSKLQGKNIDGACLVKAKKNRIILYDDTVENESNETHGQNYNEAKCNNKENDDDDSDNDYD